MDITQVIQSASRAPEFEPVMREVQAELADAAPEQLDELIALIEFALRNPRAYPQIRAAALADDMAEPEHLPEQFDAQVLGAVLAVLYRLREGVTQGSAAQLRMARGGLANMRSLARRGRMGDTQLAHISPEEAALLKARGGAGTINPATGLPQYFKLKRLLGAVLPIALNFVVPGIGSAIGAALLPAGASAAAASALGGAILGGVSSGLTGGNVLQGAVLGGLGGGMGGAVGSATSDALNLGLGATGQAALGGALVGGLTGAATGQGFGRGALMGAAGAGLGALGQAAGAALPGAVGAGLGAGTQVTGNMLTAGYRPQEAVTGGALAGLATGMMRPPAGVGQTTARPSESVVESLRTALPETAGLDLTQPTARPPFAAGMGATALPAPEAVVAPLTAGVQPAPAAGGPAGLPRVSMGNVLAGLTLAGSLASPKPAAVQAAIQRLSPEQQAYFDRPNVAWDWGRMQSDAAASGQSLAEFMAGNWPSLTGYSAPAADARSGAYARSEPRVAMAQGGALSAVARFARGAGSGRDDTIDARLSDGEYVMDAETVAMLGDGSNQEGARRLDEMRRKLRQHKGRALSRGRFSPDAKSPLAYLAGAAR